MSSSVRASANRHAVAAASRESGPSTRTGAQEQVSSAALVGSVTRAIDILDALSAAPEGMELVAIARAVGMSPSGVHRTLRTLLEGGLVQQHELRGGYRLGLKLLVWAQQMHTEVALKAAAEPELAALNAATNESVLLSVVRDRRIWTISSTEGRGQLVARPALDELTHFHATARGKLILAYMDRQAARALIASTGLPSLTPHTISDEKALWSTVDEARRNGYAIGREETFLGGGGIAVPILDAAGRLIACIALSVPMVRFDHQREKDLLEHARHAATRIEEAWNPPAPDDERGEGG